MVRKPFDCGFERELLLLKQESLPVHYGSDIFQNSTASAFQVVLYDPILLV